MARIFFACIILVIVGCNAMASRLQLSSLIESSMKDKEPNWRLYSKEAEPRSTIYIWKSGKDILVAKVFVTASEQAASDTFRKYARRFAVPPKERLKDLGDEALIFQSDNFPSGSLLFRNRVLKRVAANLADLF